MFLKFRVVTRLLQVVLLSTLVNALAACMKDNRDAAEPPAGANNGKPMDQNGKSDFLSPEEVFNAYSGTMSSAVRSSERDLTIEANYGKALKTQVREDASLPHLTVDPLASVQANKSKVGFIFSADLRKSDTPVKNQGRRGTCTSFAVVATLENRLKQREKKEFDLSEEHAWSLYHRPNTERAISAVQGDYLVEESMWTYDGSHDRDDDDIPKGPSESERKDKGVARLGKVAPSPVSALSEVVSILGENSPAILSFAVNSSFHHPRQGVIDTREDEVIGGHAIEISGVVLDSRFPAGGYFILKNSWSANWGDHGYAYMPFDYCQKFRCTVYKVESVDMKSNDYVQAATNAVLNSVDQGYVDLVLKGTNAAVTGCTIVVDGATASTDTTGGIKAKFVAIDPQGGRSVPVEVILHRLEKVDSDLAAMKSKINNDFGGKCHLKL